MFGPLEILDHNRFLEPISTGAAVKAAVAGRLMRLRSARLVWLAAGAGILALITWAVLTTPDTRQYPERAAPGEVHPQARTPVQADKLEPINPGAVGTPHAIVSETSLPNGVAVGRTAPPLNTTRERVRVASIATIHSGPSVADTLLGTAPVGAEAEVAARDADWVKIIDPVSGKVGWINSDHLVSAPAGEQSPNDQLDQLSIREQQAALGDEQEAVPLPPPQRSLKKKSQKKVGEKSVTNAAWLSGSCLAPSLDRQEGASRSRRTLSGEGHARQTRSVSTTRRLKRLRRFPVEPARPFRSSPTRRSLTCWRSTSSR